MLKLRLLWLLCLIAALIGWHSAHALNAQSFEQIVTDRLVAPAETAAQVQAGFPAAIIANWSEPATAGALIENLMQSPYTVYTLTYQFGEHATEAQWGEWDDEIAAAVGSYGLLAFEEMAADEAYYDDAYDKMMARAKAYPSPTIWMTFEEIYLEFATATSTTISSGAAIAYTGLYAAWQLDAAFWVGYGVGTVTNNLIQEYDPTFDVDLATAIVNLFNTLAVEIQLSELVDTYNWVTGVLDTDYPVLP
jgi:hypothetical protein